MTTAEFIADIEATYAKGIEIIKKKNADYSGLDDPFKNFELAGYLGVRPDKAIVVRLADKMQRVANLLDKDAQVLDESIEDTLMDLINYAAILKAYLKKSSK